MSSELHQAALDYHQGNRPGKLIVSSHKPLETREDLSPSKFIPRTANVVFPQERFQFSHSLSLLYFLLPIQITCVFEKIILS
jgi:hypothetical protein